MKKLNGTNKINIAVFISGKGSNLKNLIKHSYAYNSKFRISLIITDNSKALGLKFAKKFHIKKKIVNFDKTNLVEKNLVIVLKKYKIKIICLSIIYIALIILCCSCNEFYCSCY